MSLSKRNRRGLLWLLMLGVAIAYTPRGMSAILANEEPVISHESILEAHNELVEKELTRELEKAEVQKSRYSIPPERFDPNTYTLADWEALGLTDRQAEVIVNFSKRGLKSNEDLEMIFVLPKELFELIKDSTFYPIELDNSNREFESTYFEPIDINSATAELLQTIPGIGSFYSEKIVEYRNQLGGFVGREQLLEIWKFDQVKLEEIEQYIKLESSSLVKLNINSATIDELKSHPYINYSVANSIVKMRSQAPFLIIEDIQRSKLIDQELMTRITPYLKVQ